MSLYSNLKMFHYPAKLQSLTNDTMITPPLHIRLKPTNACNHRCRYCAYLNPEMQLGKDMRVTDSIPHDKMLEICSDIAEMGVGAVTYSGGGEPLLSPHILEASQLLHDGGVKVACLTNGSLLHGANADFFAHNATWVRVSMDGWDDASYMHYRGVKNGEFTKIMQNLENFAKLGGGCVLGVSYIVDAHNCRHLLPMLARLKNAGVGSVKVSVCISSNDPAVNKAYHAPHFEQVKNDILHAQETLTASTFEIHDGFHDLDERFLKDYTWCPYMQIQSVIGADLCIYACHDKAYTDTGIIGCLREQRLRDFWLNNKDSFFRIRPCVDCQHHCVANEKNRILLEFLQTDVQHRAFV